MSGYWCWISKPGVISAMSKQMEEEPVKTKHRWTSWPRLETMCIVEWLKEQSAKKLLGRWGDGQSAA